MIELLGSFSVNFVFKFSCVELNTNVRVIYLASSLERTYYSLF